MEKEKNVIYYDVLNILACIAVVAMHHNSIVHTFSDTVAWKQALIVEVIAYWAVPVFFMLSGAKLLTYGEKYDTKTFLCRRMAKILPAFLFWSLLLIVMKSALGKYILSDVSIRGIVESVLNYDIESTYWYIPSICSMYLLMPVLSILTDSKYRNLMWYMVGTIFIFQSCLPVIVEMLGIHWNTNWNSGMGSRVLYIILGYLLSTEDIPRRKRNILYSAGVFGVIFRYVSIYVRSMRIGEKDTLLFNSSYFPAVLLACAVFVAVKEIDFRGLIKSSMSRNAIQRISECTFGIYMLHYAFIMPLEKMVFKIEVESLAWRTVWVIITYVVTLIAVLILKRIPIIRKFVP